MSIFVENKIFICIFVGFHLEDFPRGVTTRSRVMKAFKLLKNAGQLPSGKLIHSHIYTNNRKSFPAHCLQPMLFNSSLITLRSLRIVQIVEGSRVLLKNKGQFYTNAESFVYTPQIILYPVLLNYI